MTIWSEPKTRECYHIVTVELCILVCGNTVFISRKEGVPEHIGRVRSPLGRTVGQ